MADKFTLSQIDAKPTDYTILDTDLLLMTTGTNTPFLSSMKEGSPLGKGLEQSVEASIVFSSRRHQAPALWEGSGVGNAIGLDLLEFNFS